MVGVTEIKNNIKNTLNEILRPGVPVTNDYVDKVYVSIPPAVLMYPGDELTESVTAFVKMSIGEDKLLSHFEASKKERRYAKVIDTGRKDIVVVVNGNTSLAVIMQNDTYILAVSSNMHPNGKHHVVYGSRLQTTSSAESYSKFYEIIGMLATSGADSRNFDNPVYSDYDDAVFHVGLTEEGFDSIVEKAIEYL